MKSKETGAYLLVVYTIDTKRPVPQADGKIYKINHRCIEISRRVLQASRYCRLGGTDEWIVAPFWWTTKRLISYLVGRELSFLVKRNTVQ